MSDEPSASTARQAADHGQPNEPSAALAIQKKRERNRRAFNKKRESLLADLMRGVDILVYAELSIIYHMDCSFLRLVIRAFVQFVMLTPKPAILPEPPQPTSPIGLIFGTNLLCALLHMALSRPEAGEATRGYLHGGLAMDFVGQKGPSSKIHLVLLDMLVLFLQLVNLGVMLTRRKAKAASEAPSASAPTTASTTEVPVQTLDAEERGVLQSDHQAVDIELQDLNPTAPQEVPETDVADDDEREREALLSSSRPSSDAHLFDAFNSGEIMIADLNLPSMIKDQIINYRNPAAENGSASTGITTASFTGTNMGFRLRVGNRIWGL